MEKYYKGSGMKNITKTKILNIKIPLFSPKIQQQIVNEVLKIETSIKTLDLRIAQLKQEKDQYKKNCLGITYAKVVEE